MIFHGIDRADPYLQRSSDKAGAERGGSPVKVLLESDLVMAKAKAR